MRGAAAAESDGIFLYEKNGTHKQFQLVDSMLFAQVIFLAVFWSMLMKYFWGKDNSASPPEKNGPYDYGLVSEFLNVLMCR